MGLFGMITLIIEPGLVASKRGKVDGLESVQTIFGDAVWTGLLAVVLGVDIAPKGFI